MVCSRQMAVSSGEVLVTFFAPMFAVSLHRCKVLLDNDAFGKLDFLREESSAKAQRLENNAAAIPGQGGRFRRHEPMSLGASSEVLLLLEAVEATGSHTTLNCCKAGGSPAGPTFNDVY
jgi:hypothetical protein